MAFPISAETIPTDTFPTQSFPPELIALIVGMYVLMLIWMLALHIYKAVVLMTVARKTNTPNGWLAFIPVAHLYLKTQIAKVHWALMFIPVVAFLLMFIPLIGFVFSLLFWITLFVWNGFIFWKICEARGKPGWWGILIVIPVVGWVMMGLLAWQD